MADRDDSVAHFFGGRAETAAAPATAQADDFGFEDEETVVEGEIAVDVYQTDQEVVIISPIAGVDPKDLEISAGENEITIAGERRGRHLQKSGNVITQEIYWGSFSRTVALPAGADPERAQAAFKHGVLTVRVPKTATAKKKTIRVRTDE